MSFNSIMIAISDFTEGDERYKESEDMLNSHGFLLLSFTGLKTKIDAVIYVQTAKIYDTRDLICIEVPM